ncbi:MAG: redoxin domain-containing protein [Verrucomicrobiales bacterium]|nr:redoxin domain-containing protein [Verrucomicrobiales bacterium]
MKSTPSRRFKPATAAFAAAAIGILATGCEGDQKEPQSSGAEENGISAMFAGKLETAGGGDFDAKILNRSDLILLYFSAGWCGPCKTITPIIKRLEEEAENVSVVLVNLDFSDEEKAQYLEDSKIDWPSVKGTQNETIQGFVNEYKARRLPTLIVLSPGGDVITKDGIEDLRSDPDGALAKWKTQMQTASAGESS